MPRLTVVLAALAALTALVVAALTLLPGPLYAAEVLDLGAAFTLLLDAAPPAATVAIVLGVLCSAIALWRRAWGMAAVGAVAGLVGAAAVISVSDFRRTAAAHPLHDVTTDIDNPPTFEALSPRQYEAGGADAPAASPHPAWRATHAEIYPDLKTVTLDVTLDRAFERATDIAEAMGWTIEGVRKIETVARLEAVDQTGWFGFRDDVVIVITAAPAGGVVVDARSVSRIGVGDVGKNAQRLRAFLDRMEP